MCVSVCGVCRTGGEGGGGGGGGVDEGCGSGIGVLLCVQINYMGTIIST